ncbi:FtsK/SpoIIIE domain-containing protein [Pseudonocardia ailaonensis]|uniref:FtsK/SpoIIIE domain-containing protein n=1 Tax=Pseudonocardia ailaonensis TaxID=367279 RepID=A0ABN2NPG1_9PSEU
MSAEPIEQPAEVEPEPVDRIPEPRKTAFDRITAHREGTKRPVVLPWLREREQRAAILRWAAGYSGHVALFHLVRLPVYGWRVARRSPVGAWRVSRWVVDGMTDAEARPLRRSAVARDDVTEYLRLARERNARVRHRALAAVLLGVPLLGFALWLVFAATGLAFWAALVVVVGGLGVAGRDREKPLISKATTPAYLAPVLRRDAVDTALRALPGMKRDAVIEYPHEIFRDGPGYLCHVRLPHGFTVSKVLGLKEELANGLRRPTGAVWPEGDDDDASILKLWVGFQSMGKMRQPAWPLMKGQADFFQPIPYGTDNRLRTVKITLFENNIVCGAIPGAGKSAAIRTIALGAALDPTVQLRLWSLKQNDLAALERISHTFGYGLTDDVLEACLADLAALKKEIIRRTTVLSKQPKELCPDGKLTRQLANRRDLGLQPIVMVIDECQNLFSHEEHGGAAGKLAMDVIRMGRAYGVVLILCTQRPDTNSLPKGVSANAGVKICLRMTDHQAVDMVLGTGAHSRGLKAELFKQSEKGVGYVLGATDEDIVARSFYIDAIAADRIAERAHALRVEEDRITGHALGVEADEAEEKAAGFDLLEDLIQVMTDQGLTWMWNVAAVGALATLRPEVWEGLNEASIGQLLAKRGVTTRPLNRKDPLDPPGSPRRHLTGFELADVHAARNIHRGELRAL